MKKTLALLLSLVILCTCAGCGNERMNQNANEEPKEPETETITLTKDNFEEYFNVNAYTSDYFEDGRYNTLFGGYDYNCRCNLNIEISKTCDFEVQDVTITFKIITFWDYVQESYSVGYDEYIDITLPQSGEIKKIYNCTIDGYSSYATSTPSAYFESVTGTIVIEK